MKTYLFPEVAANGEITEWVPADVARELFIFIESAPMPNQLDFTNPERFKRIYSEWYAMRESSLVKARGES